jgi:hypothetical protein
MLVIDGKQGKSRRLEEILKEKKTTHEDTIILDTVGIYSLINYGQCYKVPSVFEVSQFLYDYTQMSEPFGIKVDKDKLKYFVLELNTTRDMIDSFNIWRNSQVRKL